MGAVIVVESGVISYKMVQKGKGTAGKERMPYSWGGS